MVSTDPVTSKPGSRNKIAKEGGSSVGTRYRDFKGRIVNMCHFCPAEKTLLDLPRECFDVFAVNPKYFKTWERELMHDA